MAISFPLSLPSGAPRQITLRARSAVGVSASPFGAEQQVYVHQGELWEAEIALPPMKRDNAEEWIAFLLALNGREGTFLMGDPAGVTPRGAATGTPLVNGAAQSGKTLVTDGWTPNITGILKAGDWLQLGSGADTRLHKLVQAANSDGSGSATLEIWPRLRSSPADNATLTVQSARGLWRLSSNEREWGIEPAMIYGIGFKAVEAL